MLTKTHVLNPFTYGL